jgi:hypothetical protein
LVLDGEVWVLAAERPIRALGPAMAWARQRGGRTLSIVADESTGVLARRATLFRDPPHVWRVEGTRLEAARPEPAAAQEGLPPEVMGFVDVMLDAGAEPVVEHGVLTGEVRGLEVCRVVVGSDGTGALSLEVGIGRHDREAFALLHGEVPPAQALARVVAVVAEHRRPHGPAHPLQRMSPERLLRWRLIEDPTLIGCADLHAAPPPVPRTSVDEAVPSVAAGVDGDGRAVVVVSSVGIDLDLVPFAADARAALDPEARLVLALAPRDDHPVTEALASRLVAPALVRTVADLG